MNNTHAPGPCATARIWARRPVVRRMATTIAAAGLLIGLLPLAGATATASTPAHRVAYAASDAKVLGISMPALSNDFYIAENDIVRSDAKAAGWKLLATTNANEDANQQLANVQTLITEGATAIVMDPYNSSAIVAALNVAQKAHVPVVTIDVGAVGGFANMFVAFSNYAGGQDQCKTMGPLLKKDGHTSGVVLLLQGPLASTSSIQRSNGFTDCMKASYPSFKVVAESTNLSAQTGVAETEAALTKYPNLVAIDMFSDCVLYTAIHSTLVHQGRDYPVGSSKHIVLGAIDGCPPAITAIGQPKSDLDFTVEQPLVAYGQRAIYYLDEALAHKSVSVGPDGFGGQIVKAPSGLSDIVPATVVTKANANSPANWAIALKKLGG